MPSPQRKYNKPRGYRQMLAPSFEKFPEPIKEAFSQVAEEYDLPIKAILRRTKKPEIVEARHEIMSRIACLRNEDNKLYRPERIGFYFGMHRTSVLYGLDRARDRRLGQPRK